MSRPIEVIIDPELRHRLGAGADLAGGSRILAERIARRRRRRRDLMVLLWAVGLTVWALAVYGGYELFSVLL